MLPLSQLSCILILLFFLPFDLIVLSDLIVPEQVVIHIIVNHPYYCAS